jgi:dihydrofolate reductase
VYYSQHTDCSQGDFVRKVIADMTMSLDGFIAGTGGDDAELHQWVFNGTVPVTVGGMTFHLASESSAEYFKEFVQNAGAVVLGKTSFKASGENAPFQLPSFVLTHTPKETITKDGATITFVADGIESALAQAKAAAGDKDVYIFGGANAVQQYLCAGLLDEIHINLVPRLLGTGIRLFDERSAQLVEMEITRVTPSQGVTHLIYRIKK